MVRKGFILILCLGCGSQVPRNDVPDTVRVEVGHQLNYNLAFGAERYQFIVDIERWEPDRSFRYTMTNLKRTSGKVHLQEAALDTARREVNTFSGQDLDLGADELTVWISRRCFAELMDTDSTRFNPGRSAWDLEPSVFVNRGVRSYDYELNGRKQEIEVVVAESMDGKSEFWILNDRQNPMIIRMDVGWVIWLKEINFS